MRCVITNWEYLDSLCRKVAEQIIEDGFEPDTIVALARGGWFVGTLFCDIMGLEDLVTLGIKHYVGYDRRELKVHDVSLEYRENVLIVDDLINTGASMTKAKEIVGKSAKNVKTACLLLVSTSKFVPNYFGEYLEGFSWVIFPWNIVEDLSSLIRAVMREKELWTLWEIKSAIYKHFKIDPIYLEITNPRKFESVLKVMEMKGEIETVEVDGEKYYKLK